MQRHAGGFWAWREVPNAFQAKVVYAGDRVLRKPITRSLERQSRLTGVLAMACAAALGCAEPSSNSELTDDDTSSDDSSSADDEGSVPDGDYPCRAEADGTTTAVFVNRCDAPVEIRGSDIEGGTVAAGAFVCRDLGTSAEPISSKRYWGFIGEDPGGEHHTLAEFTFNTDFNDFDWYNISHVDAHNLLMQIVPLDRPDCDTLTCDAPSLLADCPEVGRWLDDNGTLISCESPERDNPESPVALHFESCDQAYAWSGDDQQGDDPSPVRACAGEDWAIIFCP